jgi:aspartyl-tRNA(Asn)/glutamyl-tRNA(Gln) amidotransferase subunit C
VRITDDDVRKVADLARLSLTPDELAKMRDDMDAILGYVDVLAQVDTVDVPPTTHPLELFAPLRPDEVSGVLPVDEALRCAPERDGGALLVPKVIE